MLDDIENLNEVLHGLLVSSAEGFIISNERGKVLLSNPAASKMFLYTQKEFESLTIEDLIPARFRKSHKTHRSNYNQKPVQRSMGIGLDLYGLKKNGVEFPIEISLNHIKHNGKLLVMALITDITDKKKIENRLFELNQELEEKVKQRTLELEKSQKLYAIIARHFPNGTINVFDEKLNYVFVEGKELFELGITSANLVGTNFIDKLDAQIREEARENLLEVFNGKPKQFEIKYKDNIYLLSAVPLPDEDNKITQILVVEQNISSQKKAEQETLNALAKEKELNELKSRFVSMASHEFRTPLSSILSSASLLEKYNNLAPTNNTEKTTKHLSRIKSSVNNLTQILNDFLSIDKLESGKVSSNVGKINLKELVHESIEEISLIKKKGQEIILDCSTKKEEVIIDGHIFKNILINLLSNAIKYSKEESKIYIKCKIEKGQLHFQVQDEGVGIPKRDLKHMFERFFRASNVTNIQGTGLGLTIVKKYLDMLGGKIKIESEENVGTTIKLTIPINEKDITN